MKILLCFLLFGLALAYGRDYCIEGNPCNANWQCAQELGLGFPYGFCCSGKCTAMTTYASRGGFCNTSNPCADQCTLGDSCVNNTCVGEATPGCTCTLSTDCRTPLIEGVPIPTSCVNGICTMELPRDAACSSDSECVSDDCYQGTCLGEALGLGSSCRLSQECDGYQCLNGKCAYKTEGMECSTRNSCDPSKYFCNFTSSECQSFVALGGFCNSASQCISSAFCNTTIQSCVAKAQEGATCDMITMPCAPGLSCLEYNNGAKECIKVRSVPDHGYCTADDQCSNSNSVCGREGANATAKFCVPNHSLKPGDPCSSSLSCPENAECFFTTSPPTCVVTMNRPCNWNSTSADTVQCGDLTCKCNSKCEATYTPYCGQYTLAPGDPTKMNDVDRIESANAACCGLCFGGLEPSLKASLTGFQINCKTLTFTMMPVCNTTSLDGPLLLNCDGWTSGAVLGSTTYLSVLFLSLVAILLH